MIKWAKVTDENTKLCEVGLGNNASFYQSIGMTQQDVEKAYNGSWYLAGYTPEEPEEEIKEKQKEELVKALNSIDFKSIRSIRAIQAGTSTAEDEQHLAELEAQAEEIREQIRALDNEAIELDNDQQID